MKSHVLASLMMFLIKDVTLNTTRGFDNNNRQLKALAIGAFKEKYDDVKIRNSSGRYARRKLRGAVTAHQKPVGLKKTLIKRNTTKNIFKMGSGTINLDDTTTAHRKTSRARTHLNVIDFGDEYGDTEDEFDDDDQLPNEPMSLFEQVSSRLKSMVHPQGSPVHSQLPLREVDEDETDTREELVPKGYL